MPAITGTKHLGNLLGRQVCPPGRATQLLGPQHHVFRLQDVGDHVLGSVDVFTVLEDDQAVGNEGAHLAVVVLVQAGVVEVAPVEGGLFGQGGGAGRPAAVLEHGGFAGEEKSLGLAVVGDAGIALHQQPAVGHIHDVLVDANAVGVGPLVFEGPFGRVGHPVEEEGLVLLLGPGAQHEAVRKVAAYAHFVWCRERLIAGCADLVTEGVEFVPGRGRLDSHFGEDLLVVVDHRRPDSVQVDAVAAAVGVRKVVERAPAGRTRFQPSLS